MLSLQTQAEAIAANYTPPDIGRPSHIGDAQLLKELFAAIEEGNYLETACDLVGLSHVTVNNWKRRGEAGEAPYDRFVTAVKGASARAEARTIANVRKASESPQFWAAGMTYLERRHPDRWGKRQDDSAAPRVVVQVGGNASDVKVAIAFAVPSVDSVASCLSEAKGESDCNLLGTQAFAESSSLITAVMVPNHEASHALEASAEGLHISAAAHGSPGPAVGAGATRARNFFAGKGRSKKKGSARRSRRKPVAGDETA